MGLLALRERPVLLLGGSAVVSVAAIGAALVSQHVYDIQPCPWCVLQRLIFAVIALACVIGLLMRGRTARRIAGGAVILLAIEGIVAALWQHFVAAASASCNLTFADRVMNSLGLDAMLPEIFQARASCADAAVKLLGVPYEFYSLALFIGLGVAGALVLVQPIGRGR
ncbi:disulfide bond formation protein B [Ideonella sp. BN130291]|uniref:disulfide bond formation protein B n=1 Tax=Ideonella sp. BN130291 TaxID=3112940 RepID=UPI002E274605|nr:disulfide bond formation protein B [Ideonella sp. BN130291]